jgi:hypothetical protein
MGDSAAANGETDIGIGIGGQAAAYVINSLLKAL